MRYVASVERIGIRKGRLEEAHENILEILKVRFEQIAAAIFEAINAIEDLTVLKDLLKKAATANSLDEFQADLDTTRKSPASDKISEEQG